MFVKKFENFELKLKVNMVMMSHLSDLQDGYEFMDSIDFNNKINFIKHLIIKYPDTDTSINADLEWEEFKKTRFYRQ